MASSDPSDRDDDPNDPFDPPKTPHMVLKEDAPNELSPDTEENVAQQTDSVFRNFVYHMNALDRSGQDADDTPALPELTAFADSPFS